jgi:hypothetical protein
VPITEVDAMLDQGAWADRWARDKPELPAPAPRRKRATRRYVAVYRRHRNEPSEYSLHTLREIAPQGKYDLQISLG